MGTKKTIFPTLFAWEHFEPMAGWRYVGLTELFMFPREGAIAAPVNVDATAHGAHFKIYPDLVLMSLKRRTRREREI